jgi:hypothetical protein
MRTVFRTFKHSLLGGIALAALLPPRTGASA